MNKRIVVVFAICALFLGGCTTPPGTYEFDPFDPVAVIDGAAQESPCTDVLYVSLKSKTLEGLSEREYEYFMQKDEACTKYQRVFMVATEETRRVEEAFKRVQKTGDEVRGVYVLLSVLGALATTTFLLMSQR